MANAAVPLDAVVAVHQAAFPGFFMTQLGPRFLREYYRCVLDVPAGILLTETKDGACVGFVAGFVDPAAFYSELRRRRARLGLAALRGIVSRPRRLMTMMANYGRAGNAARAPLEADTAELSSVAVVPAAAGQGIGFRLVRAFIDAAASAGARRVVLTTDAYGNDAVNRFYQRLGFVCTGTSEVRPGRWLNEYAFAIHRD
jgi:ribosomal protein S18 acetylase RimI-like enzyme